jgi:hypothetical protein
MWGKGYKQFVNVKNVNNCKCKFECSILICKCEVKNINICNGCNM